MNVKLEELRTKEELIKYFKQLGKNITEEEIETLKKQFEPYAKDESTLTMQQLNEVAGGLILFHITNSEHKDIIIRKINDKGSQRICTAFDHKDNLIICCDDGKNQVAIKCAQVKKMSESEFTLKMTGGEGNTLISINLDELLNDPENAITKKLDHVCVAFRSNKEDTVPITEDWKPYMQAVYNGIEKHLERLKGKDSLDTMIEKIHGLKQLREGLEKNPESGSVMPNYSYLDFTKISTGTWHGSPKEPGQKPEVKKAPLSPASQLNKDVTPIKLPPGFELAKRPTNSPNPSSTAAPSSTAQQPNQYGLHNEVQVGDPAFGAPPPTIVPAAEPGQSSSGNSETLSPPPSVSPTPLSRLGQVDSQNGTQTAEQFGSDESQPPLQLNSAQPGAIGQKSSDAEKQGQPLIQDKEQYEVTLEDLNRLADAAKETLEEQQKSNNKKVKEQKKDRVIIASLYILGIVAIAGYTFSELDKKDFNKGISEISKLFNEIFNKIFKKDKNGNEVK